MVFIIVVGGTSFAWVESLFSNEDLGNKSFSVSTCGILAGIKGASIKADWSTE